VFDVDGVSVAYPPNVQYYATYAILTRVEVFGKKQAEHYAKDIVSRLQDDLAVVPPPVQAE
jgi:hypothetical protein